MSWEKYAYTSAGAAMLSESISGGALTITRAVSGTGTVDTDLSEETAVSGDTYELKLLGIRFVLHPCHRLEVRFQRPRVYEVHRHQGGWSDGGR